MLQAEISRHTPTARVRDELRFGYYYAKYILKAQAKALLLPVANVDFPGVFDGFQHDGNLARLQAGRICHFELNKTAVGWEWGISKQKAGNSR